MKPEVIQHTHAHEEDPLCESCLDPRQRVVHAQFGISLASHGLASRFCSSCLYAELVALGLRVVHPDWSPVTEPMKGHPA